jgi:hypothetical protein
MSVTHRLPSADVEVGWVTLPDSLCAGRINVTRTDG